MMLQQPAFALSMAVIAVVVAQSTLSYALSPLSLMSLLPPSETYGNGGLGHLPITKNLHKRNMGDYNTHTSQIPNIFSGGLSNEEATMKSSASGMSEDEYADSNADFSRLWKRMTKNRKIETLGRLLKWTMNNEKPGMIGSLMDREMSDQATSGQQLKEMLKPRALRSNESKWSCVYGPYSCLKRASSAALNPF